MKLSISNIRNLLALLLVSTASFADADHRQNVDSPEQRAEERFRARDFSNAMREYLRATELNGNSPELWIKLGDCYDQLTYDQPDNFQRAIGAWHRATELTPGDLAVQKRILNRWLEFARTLSGPHLLECLDSVRLAAEAVAEIDPADSDAKFAIAWTDLEVAVNNPEMDEKAVADATDSLTRLQNEMESAVVRTLSNARGTLGLRRSREGNVNAALTQFRAAQEILDESGAHPFAQTQLISVIMQTPQDAQANPELRAFLDAGIAGLRSSLSAAQSADVDLPLYADAVLLLAADSARKGDFNDATTLLRVGIAAKPTETQLRIRLADLIRRTNPQEALDILIVYKTPPELSGYAGSRVRIDECAALLKAIDIRLRFFMEKKSSNVAEADEFLRLAVLDLEKIRVAEPDRPRTVCMDARVRVLKADYRGALAVIGELLPKIRQQDSDRVLPEALRLAAQSHIQLGNTLEAEGCYREILQITDLVPVRIALVRLLLDRKANDEADQHLEILKKSTATDPQVNQLIMQRAGQ